MDCDARWRSMGRRGMIAASRSFCRQLVLLLCLLPQLGLAATIVVSLPGNVREIDAGSVTLSGASNGLPEAIATNTNTASSSITTNITTLSNNTLLLDVVGSGNGGSFSPGGGQTERWDQSNFSSTGAASTRAVAAAGATSMTQTHSTTSNRSAHAVIALAPATAGGSVAVAGSAGADAAGTSTLSWTQALPSASGAKLIVGVSIEEDTSCPGNSTVGNVTYDGTPMTRIVSEQVETNGNFCMRTEIWYADLAAVPLAPAVQWRFDEVVWDGTVGEVVDSIGGLNGTSFSSTTTAGLVCNAGDFSANGTADYLSMDSAALNGATDFTISVWGKTANTGSQAIFSGSSGSQHNELILWFNNATTFTPYLKGSGSGAITISSIANDQWHHFVWTRSGAQNCFYIDSTLQGCSNKSTAALAIASGGLIIAQEQDNLGTGFDPNQDWEGLLDEPLIFSQALAAAEVSSIYTNQLAGNDWDGSARICPTANLPLAEWRFDETSWNGTAGEIVDETGNGNDGVAVGAAGSDPAPATPPGSAIAGDPGTCGIGVFPANSSAAVIDAVDSGLDVDSDIGNAGTITLWYYSNANWSGGGDRQILDAANPAAAGGAKYFFLTLLNSGRLRFGLEDSADGDFRVSSPVQGIAADTWTHIAVSWDLPNDSLVIYVNGVAVANLNPNTNGVLGELGSLFIGDNNGAYIISGDTTPNSANGGIDEVRAYAQVLDAATIQAIAAETHACPATPSRRVILSVDGNNGATLGGLSFADQDLADYNPATDTAVLFAEGATIFDNDEDINAVYVADNGNIIFSANGNFSIGGVSFQDADLAEYDPSTGVASMFLDGSLVFSGNEDIDGVHVLDNGNILLSTDSGASIGALNFADEDIVEFNPATGAATLFFDGSALISGGDTDLRGIHILDNGNIVFSIDNNNRTLGGLTFSDEDLAEYDPGADTATLFLDGSLFTSSEDINAVHVIEVVAVALDHYSISHDGTGVTCLSEEITITAHDSSHAAVDPGGVNLALSTSTLKGDWVGVASGGGGLVDAVPGDGAATYNIPAGETGVVLRFNYTDIGAGTSETFSINVTDGSVSETSGSATLALDDPDLTTSLVGLEFSTIAAQIAGKDSNIAPGSAITLRAVRASDSDPTVCDALLANQSYDVEFGAECRNPGSCNGGQTRINGAPIATNDDNAAALTTAYAAVNLAFDAAGDANLILNYSEAGLLQLHSRLDIPLDDGSGLPSGDFAVGSSNDFVVKPAGLCVASADANADCASGDASCSLFGRAGEAFNLTVSGVAWEAAGESDADFCSGNAITQNFRLNGIALTPNLVAPIPGTNAVLGDSSVDIVAADNGSHTTATQSSSEVGVFTISATPPAYMGESIAASTSANIGRFYPDHFELSLGSVSEACASGVFTYLDQDFAVTYRLTANNTGGTTTTNYRDGFIRLDAGQGTLSYGAVDQGAAQPLTGRLAKLADTLSWNNDGSGDLGASLNLARLAAPDGPFAADIGVVPVDADGVTISASGLNLDVDLDTSVDHGLIGQSTQRYGRLLINNAFGPEVLALSLPLRAQFWNGTAFVVNLMDSCTTLTDVPVPGGTPGDPDSWGDFELSGYTAGLAPGETAPAFAAIVNGNGALDLSAPGAGNTGAVRIDVRGPAWLRFDYDANPGTPDEDAHAEATFGQYRGNDRVIYWRELIPVQ